MLNGKELGAAIKAAIEKKIASGSVASQAAIARHFGVKPPSIHDWVKKGSISKDKLPELWRYFSDVVGPEHWGLSAWPELGTPPESAKIDWPFPRVPEKTIRNLPPEQVNRLEGALLLALAQLGVAAGIDGPHKQAPQSGRGGFRTYEEVEDPFWSPPPEPMPWEPGARTVRSEALAQEKKLRISRASDVSANADAGYSANDHEFTAVPELGVRLAAGKLGIENYEETKIGEIQFRRSFLESFGLPIERMSIVYADGDSMMPIIRHRGPMLFYEEEITSRHQLDPRTVYAINHGGNMIVKCIGRTRGGTWLAKSINTDHAPFPLDGEDGREVRIVGRILWSPYDLRHGVDSRLLT